MAGDKASRKPVHEEFAEQIIADLKKGVAPWQKPWRPGELHPPLNPVSGTVYSGINRVMLSRRGFEDPRWMTLKQANTKDCRVRKGEKSQTIVYWQFSKEEPVLDDKGQPVIDAEGNQVKNKVELARPVVRFSSVFHVGQLDGDIPHLDTTILTPAWNPNEKAETILQNSGAIIKHNQRNRAFYSLRTDEICLPPQDHFNTADGYYSTALHELGHWTGHASRLARDFGPFGSETYAREELRAEIASWMVAQDMGIGHDPGQHLAYVDSWVAALEKDPYEIVRACRDAERIKHYVLAMEMKQELSKDLGAAPATRRTLEDGPQEAAKEPAEKKVFLAVPFREKERAKTAGAKWDSEAKLWFAPEGSDMAKLRTWLPDKTLKASPAMPPMDEFALALRDAGLDLKGQQPIMDGNIHRVPVQGGKPHALDGAYQGYLDGRPAGWYQNFLTGEKVNWKATGHTLTEEQKIALRLEAEQRSQQRERERLEQQDAVARQCSQDFAALPPIRPMAAISNPYLLRKGVAPLGDIKESSDAMLLLVPLFNATGELRNVQEISWDGGKRFQAGGEKKGCFCLIDPANNLEQGEILLAEGYATGVSLNMATGKPVAVAFDAGNLEPVALALREKYPLAKIAICADNDHEREQGNIGLEKAKQAALAVDGCVILPQFNRQELDGGLTDFNDLHNSRGLKEVTTQVAMGLAQEKSCELERQ